MMQRFRTANATFESNLQSHGQDSLEDTRWLTVEVAAALAILLAGGILLVLRRYARIEQQRLRGQSDLRELLQASQSEDEARKLLVSHVERIIPGSGAAVLNRNNSDDKLEPMLSERAHGDGLGAAERRALSPHSCLAVRLSHAHESTPGDESLVQCEACGKVGANVVCEPLLVGGRGDRRGALAQEKKIKPRERQAVRDAVTQAAPILANQRNLALAERRATSDQLTGLPNRRAADEALRRMAAHARRSGNPLAAVLLDLDHFKQINDVHGHKSGDEVLATIGSLLIQRCVRATSPRATAARSSCCCSPTPTARARWSPPEAAHWRSRRPTSPPATVTASFGVAVLPDDAGEIDQLIREADRALYRAKAARAQPRRGGQQGRHREPRADCRPRQGRDLAA